MACQVLQGLGETWDEWSGWGIVNDCVVWLYADDVRIWDAGW